MGVPIPISDGPQLISRSVAKPYLVLNNGSNTVYLGTDSSVSSMAYAFPLASGSAFQWTEIDSDVYAVCDKGKTSQLVVAPEASAMAFGTLNASIQGTVPVSGSVDTTGSTIGVSGTVDTTGSTIHSRSQNSPVVLSQTTTAIAASIGSPQPITAIPSLPTAGYSSIIVSISDNCGAPLAFTSMIKIVVTQTLNGVQVGTFINAHYLLGNCNGSVQVPVIGDTLQISGQYINSSTSTGTLTVQAIGSSEVIPTPKYLSYNLSGKGSIATGGYYEDSVGVATLAEFVNSRNGAAEVSVLAGSSSSTGNLNIQLADFDNPGSGIILMGTGAIAAGAALNIPVILPMRPVNISARGTAGFIIYSLQQ